MSPFLQIDAPATLDWTTVTVRCGDCRWARTTSRKKNAVALLRAHQAKEGCGGSHSLEIKVIV